MMLIRVIDATYYPGLFASLIAISLYLLHDAILLVLGWFALMMAVVAVLKRVVRSQRPDLSDCLSFPSGHSAAASFIAGTIGFWAWSEHKIKRVKRHHLAVAIVIGVWALLVAWSRVHLLRHRVLDVLVGLAMGVCFSYGLRLHIGQRYKNKLGIGLTSER